MFEEFPKGSGYCMNVMNDGTWIEDDIVIRSQDIDCIYGEILIATPSNSAMGRSPS